MSSETNTKEVEKTVDHPDKAKVEEEGKTVKEDPNITDEVLSTVDPDSVAVDSHHEIIETEVIEDPVEVAVTAKPKQENLETESKPRSDIETVDAIASSDVLQEKQSLTKQDDVQAYVEQKEDKTGFQTKEDSEKTSSDVANSSKTADADIPAPETPALIPSTSLPPKSRPSFNRMKPSRPMDLKISSETGPKKPPRTLATPLTFDSVLTEPGPEEYFTEIPIDTDDSPAPTPTPTTTRPIARNKQNGSRHIAFDKSLGEEDDDADYKIGIGKDDVPLVFEKSRMEKFINYILCRKDLADQKLTEKPVKFSELFKYGTKVDLMMVAFGLFMAGLCGLVQPIFAVTMGKLVNALLLLDITDPQFKHEGLTAVIIFIVAGTCLVVVAYAQFCVFAIACSRITRRIRGAYLRSILRQDQTWFEKTHSGMLTTKLNDNIERINEGIGDKLGLLTRTMVQYVTGIIVALIVSWQMALPLMLFSPVIAFTMAFHSKRIGNAARNELSVYGQAGAIAEEAIMAYRTVAAFDAQETEVKRYKTALEAGHVHGVQKARYSGLLSGMMMAFVMIYMGVAILYGTWLHAVGVVASPGDIFVVLLAIMSGAYHLGHASPHLMVILTARVAAASVYKTIDRIPDIDPYASADKKKLYDLKGKIAFKNVYFRYPSRPDVKVLKSLSFTVNPGQTIALVGASGSGKSTVVSILNRLYEYESGSVMIDGVDVRDLNVHWLRTVIGTVQQEPIIFNDTVENNIKKGCKETLTERELIAAAKAANAHEFIEALPSGYATRIGDGGVQLSGGQKQRIAIARTLARNPRILLLDEATSALDTASEALVQEALQNAAKNRTTIIIAHRLSTIRDVDRIIVMNQGRFVEAGTHTELLRRQGMYARLVRAQELKQIQQLEDDSEIESPEGSELSSPMVSALQVKEVRESIRASFARDFLPSGHAGDAEMQAMNIEMKKTTTKPPPSFFQIFYDAKSLWPMLILAIIVCGINALAMPLTAIVFGRAFEMFDGGRKDNIGEAALFFLFFVLIGLASLAASFLTTYLFGRIGETITMGMRVRAFRAILSQDGAYFDNPAHTPGKLIARLATDAPNVKAAMDTRLGRIVQGVLSLIAATAMSAWIHLGLAFACCSIFIVMGIFMFAVAKIAHSRAAKFARNDESGRIAIEAIENAATIQLLTAEHEVHDQFVESAVQRQEAELRKTPIEAMNFATTHGLQQFALAFCYIMGYIFVLNGIVDKVVLFQVVQTMYFGAFSMIQATEHFPELVKSRLATGLMYSIIDEKPSIDENKKADKIKLSGEVTLDKVVFAYPARPETAIMKSISLRARPGQTVALVGPSGSGKSTIIALLERLYDPSVGSILLDGRDLKTLNLRDVRSQMALVEQMPRLFSGTIRENIAYGLDLEKVTMDQIREAAITANAAGFIECLPMGYETPLGERGAQLSGGQKQRIAIARAVVRNPKILLLDEATAALDSASEKAVQEALDAASHGRTSIVVAHRLSSIQHADQIIFVEAGRIRERGTHEELIRAEGKYFGLSQRQHLGAQ
uniref:ABC transmembrane type-1 domain-containing protein n=1 Tax=Panagrellus redivivus TaxID=6233 RepID=A0A7E4UZ02_PANRE